MSYSIIIGLVTIGLLESLIGLVVFLRSKFNPINITFALMVTSISIWTLLIAFFGLTDNSYHAQIAAIVFYIAGAAIGVMFFVFGQVCVRKVQLKSAVVLLPIAIWVIFTAWFIYDPTILHVGIEHRDYGNLLLLNKTGYALYALFFSSLFISGLALLLLGGKLSSDKTGRDMSSLGILIVPGGAASIITNLILPWFDNYQYIWLGPLLIALFVVGTGRQLITHRLFDIRPVVARSVVYTLVITTGFAVYIAIITFIATSGLTNLDFSAEQAALLAILSVAISALFHPLKISLDKITNKIFYRTSYSISTEVNKLGKKLLRETNTLNVIKVSVSSINAVLETVGTKTITVKNKSMRAQLSSLNKSVYSIDFDTNSKINTYLAEINASAIIDVSNTTEQLFIAIGEKKNGTALTKRDLKFLNSSTYEIAIALDNARRYSTIKRLNESLENKVMVATKKLRKANRDLTELDKAKDEFFSMASHQLRSPVSATAQAIWLLENTDAADTELTDELIATAKESSARMASLVEDMFSSAKLSTGVLKIKKSDTDLSRLLATRVKIAQQSATNKNQHIALTTPNHVTRTNIDSAAIREILANFLENAIKYSPSSATINVSLEDKDSYISVHISDQGIGVPTKDHALLFTKFFRASNAIDSREGTGLGLFLAKQIIELHDGKIIFESDKGEGSVFGFRLPK